MASDEPVNPKFRQLLEEFDRHIREDANLEHLKVIRRQIRKALPLAVRAYLPAYLLKEAAGGGLPKNVVRQKKREERQTPPRSKRTEQRAKESKRRDEEQTGRQTAGRPWAAEDKAEATRSDMARLFVSVGRSRRISRQMLSDLFVAKLELAQERIGEVRVLDNFSFIEIPTELAQSAIDRISGETLNGRRVTVDYARTKKS